MRLSPVSLRTGCLPLIAAGLSLGLAAQEPGTEEVLHLPTYTVTAERELPPPERWHYARLPGFEVLSNASEGKTRDLLDSFQRFTNALNLVWPGMIPRDGAPAALIICGSGDQFGAFLPVRAPGTDQAMVSLTLRSREQAAIVLDLQTKVLNLVTAEGAAAAAVVVDDDGIPTGSGGDPGFAVDAYQQLNREYLRFLLASLEPKPPVWFAEGLAQLFMAMEVTDTTITLGKLEDPNILPEVSSAGRAAAVEDRDFNATLARRALLPLPEMFAVAADSPLALNPLGSTWAKQSYAFVHWGLYGDQGIHQKEFLTFVARLGREPLSEALFKDCFKKSYQDMLQALRGYIEFTRYKVAGVKAGKGQKLAGPPPVVMREATEAEIGRIKGDTLTLAGHPTAARTALVTAYRRGERDPALLAALGQREAGGGDPVKARKLLEAAMAGKVVRPRAYLELARLRLADSLAQRQGGGSNLSAGQTAQVLEPLFAATSQLPALPEIYELMAEAWAHSAFPPAAGDLALVEQGVKLFPRNAVLVYRAAELRGKNGFPHEAHSLVRLGLRIAPDATTRTRFEQLQASLPVASPTPAKN